MASSNQTLGEQVYSCILEVVDGCELDKLYKKTVKTTYQLYQCTYDLLQWTCSISKYEYLVQCHFDLQNRMFMTI